MPVPASCPHKLYLPLPSHWSPCCRTHAKGILLENNVDTSEFPAEVCILQVDQEMGGNTNQCTLRFLNTMLQRNINLPELSPRSWPTSRRVMKAQSLTFQCMR